MTRTIRPIGKVSLAMKRHGYRQQAAIYIDGKQLPHVAVLSKQAGDKIKFEGHFIDPQGELHKTNEFVDVKRAAGAIVKLREEVLAPKPAVKQDAKAKRAARRQQHTSKPTPQSIGAMIDCRGCGTRHADDDMCPED